ncbi:MAG TPA: hypothetical protein VFY84_19145, partial [Jiangellales bacterium]|nr:hypothetical protein [Jiangellales bacterium]
MATVSSVPTARVDAGPAPPVRRRGRRGSRNRDRLLAAATPLALLLVWEILVRTGALDVRFFPAPTSVFDRMVELMSTGELWT